MDTQKILNFCTLATFVLVFAIFICMIIKMCRKRCKKHFYERLGGGDSEKIIKMFRPDGTIDVELYREEYMDNEKLFKDLRKHIDDHRKQDVPLPNDERIWEFINAIVEFVNKYGNEQDTKEKLPTEYQEFIRIYIHPGHKEDTVGFGQNGSEMINMGINIRPPERVNLP